MTPLFYFFREKRTHYETNEKGQGSESEKTCTQVQAAWYDIRVRAVAEGLLDPSKWQHVNSPEHHYVEPVSKSEEKHKKHEKSASNIGNDPFKDIGIDVQAGTENIRVELLHVLLLKLHFRLHSSLN